MLPTLHRSGPSSGPVPGDLGRTNAQSLPAHDDLLYVAKHRDGSFAWKILKLSPSRIRGCGDARAILGPKPGGRFDAVSLGAGLSAVTNPYFNSCPIGQSLFRTPVPSQTVTPTQPEPAYYALRTLCTVFDEWRAEEFPVTFGGGKEFQAFTFRRGGDEFMVAAWIPGYPSDGIAEARSDVRLPGIQAKEAWVIDVMDGIEQELVISSEGNDTLIRGMMIKDYPTLIRVTKRA